MEGERLDRRLVLLLALGCGASIANIYYAQPLLAEIGGNLGVSDAVVGLLVTASQIGFAIGLAFAVPLGDLLERRKLIVSMMLVCAIALLATAAAPVFAVLATTLLVVGVVSSVTHVIVPAAASMATDAERGRVVGSVMSGLILGILCARILAGLLAELGGWRAPFAFGAAVMLVLALAIRRVVPPQEPFTEVPYRRLLRSVVTLVREQPVLRWRMGLGATGFIVFSALWTAVTFLLSREYGYSEGTIGLFGLFGVFGAAGAQAAGHLVDRGWLHAFSGVCTFLVLASWGLLALGKDSLVALIAGIVLINFALSGLQISSQGAIFSLGASIRSRVTTAFMANNFFWAALSSGFASWLYEHDGWYLVSAFGAAIALLGFTIWIAEQAWRRRSGDLASARPAQA